MNIRANEGCKIATNTFGKCVYHKVEHSFLNISYTSIEQVVFFKKNLPFSNMHYIVKLMHTQKTQNTCFKKSIKAFYS